MDKNNIKLGIIEIEKYKFHQLKRSSLVDNIDISKIVVSNKVSFAKKDFRNVLSYKYAPKFKKKASKFITGDIEISSDNSDRENSDEENSNEKN